MHKCSSTILYAACTFRPYKSTPVLKLSRTFYWKNDKGVEPANCIQPAFPGDFVPGCIRDQWTTAGQDEGRNVSWQNGSLRRKPGL